MVTTSLRNRLDLACTDVETLRLEIVAAQIVKGTIECHKFPAELLQSGRRFVRNRFEPGEFTRHLDLRFDQVAPCLRILTDATQLSEHSPLPNCASTTASTASAVVPGAANPIATPPPPRRHESARGQQATDHATPARTPQARS